jgi:hypothetical protein
MRDAVDVKTRRAAHQTNVVVMKTKRVVQILQQKIYRIRGHTMTGRNTCHMPSTSPSTNVLFSAGSSGSVGV